VNDIYFADELYKNYADFYHTAIIQRRFKHTQLQQVLDTFRSNPVFSFTLAGKSAENRDIQLIKVGTGPIKVMLWSQMHGDEPTATMALLDIFNFIISDNPLNNYKDAILQQCTLYFVPMVNPDGAERFTRRNAMGIDVNRDARRLVSPEAQLLKQLQQQIQPHFGLNLHDQELYYTVGSGGKQAALAFLAPAYNPAKEINTAREASMQLIAGVANMLQAYIPEYVSKYSDDFAPTAFGDNFQIWGTSTILIESGGYYNDFERQFIRKLNFVSILFMLYQIANKLYTNIPLSDYHKIPLNKKDGLFDIIIKDVNVEAFNLKFKTDIGIRRRNFRLDGFVDYIDKFVIADIGDLSSFSALQIIEAAGYDIAGGNNQIQLESEAHFKLLKDGIPRILINNDAIKYL